MSCMERQRRTARVRTKACTARDASSQTSHLCCVDFKRANRTRSPDTEQPRLFWSNAAHLVRAVHELQIMSKLLNRLCGVFACDYFAIIACHHQHPVLEVLIVALGLCGLRVPQKVEDWSAKSLQPCAAGCARGRHLSGHGRGGRARGRRQGRRARIGSKCGGKHTPGEQHVSPRQENRAMHIVPHAR